MTILQFANNASSSLANPITSADTTIYLLAGSGSLFPTPTTGKAFLATIYNNSSTSYEIVLVTARVGDVLTVVRAQEGTTAQTWLTGNSIGMYPTKGTMQSLIQIDQFQNGTYSYAIGGGTANALTAQIPSDLTSLPDGMNIVVKAIAANTGGATLQLTLGSTILPAYVIVKGNSYPLISGDIWANYPCIFTWSASLNAFILQNPGTSVVAPITSYNITYLLVGGGGGAASAGQSGGIGGGGGAGGVINTTFSAIPSTTYTITVGAGGATGTSGGNSIIFGVNTAVGGGNGNGGSGGSGGGGSGGFEGGSSAGAPGGAPAIGQGYAGGTGGSHNPGNLNAGGGGGGGGAGGVGGNGGFDNETGGNGGVGVSSSIIGTTNYYGGGGGGSSFASGGLGGGGAAGSGLSAPGTPGTAYTGGGGGGGGTAYGSGAAGGSGIVILQIPSANYTGIYTGSPTITTVGSNKILQFTSSGSYTA